MRRICLFVLALSLAAFLPGCGKASSEAEVLDISPDEPALSQAAAARPGGGESAEGLALRQTAAYVYEQDGAPMLYGAIAYENTGSEALYLHEASLAFSASSEREHILRPVLAPSDVLQPGEYGYAAGWFSGEGFTAGEEVELRVRLDARRAEDAGIPLRVDGLFFADNYPGFTTMTGTLYNETGQSCAMNMVTVGLYDVQDNFLGVWYFSQNARLDGGDALRFTSHLRAFPLHGLAERGVYAKGRAFGFN